MTEEREKQMVEELRGHLKIAQSWNWKMEKMLFCDGFLHALNMATGKDYGFSANRYEESHSDSGCVTC